MRLCIHAYFMRVNNAGSDLYNIEAGKVYQKDCYEATFANIIVKQVMDTRIIIVNRAKMTLVVLAEPRTNYFSTFSSCFCIFFMKTGRSRWTSVVKTIICSISSCKLEVADLCKLRAKWSAKRKRRKCRIRYFRILFVLVFYPSSTKSQFCITKLCENSAAALISASLLISRMIFIVEFYNRRINVQKSSVQVYLYNFSIEKARYSTTEKNIFKY